MQRPQQRQELRQEGRLLTIRLSDLLELSERDYRRWLALLEADPLYRLLARPPQGMPRVVRRRPWPDTRWFAAGLDWETPEPPARPAGGALPEVPPAVLETIQRLGRETFERYFLYNDGDHGIEAAAQACGIALEKARAVSAYVDSVLLEGETTPGPGVGPGAGAGSEVVAAFERAPEGFALSFLSPHYARGRYEIDYDGLEAVRRSGVVGKGEWRKVRELLGRLETANAKQTVLTGLLRLALRRQEGYLATTDPVFLQPFSQKDAAERLAVSPSAVSRALAGRGVRLPWGESRPLAALFPSQRDVAIEFVRAALAHEPALKDSELWRRLREERGIRVTMRSVNGYRRRAQGG